MIVNLYVDHMMTAPPASAEEVWNATKEHPKIYRQAAERIGLTEAEYQEFRNDLLDGKAIYVRLPAHIDAMAGDRHGSVYAVRNAYMPNRVMGWKVTLSSGAIVYVPQACGNLAMTRSRIRPKPYHPQIVKRIVPPPAQVQQQTQTQTVVVVQPTPAPYVAPPPPEAPPAPVVSSTNNNWLFAIPIVGGIIAIIATQHSPQGPPPCNQGSNEYNVCHR
jgi:hypothetical protein